MSIIQLRTEVTLNIISPAVKKEAIEERAQEMGLKSPLDRQQAIDLSNDIISSLLKKIATFMGSDEAHKIDKNVELYCSTSSFAPLIRTKIQEQIQAVYGLDIFAQVASEKSLISWLCSYIVPTPTHPL